MRARPIPAAAVLLLLAALLLASCTSLLEGSTCEAVPLPTSGWRPVIREGDALPDPGDFPPLRFAQ